MPFEVDAGLSTGFAPVEGHLARMQRCKAAQGGRWFSTRNSWVLPCVRVRCSYCGPDKVGLGYDAVLRKYLGV